MDKSHYIKHNVVHSDTFRWLRWSIWTRWSIWFIHHAPDLEDKIGISPNYLVNRFWADPGLPVVLWGVDKGWVMAHALSVDSELAPCWPSHHLCTATESLSTILNTVERLFHTGTSQLWWRGPCVFCRWCDQLCFSGDNVVISFVGWVQMIMTTVIYSAPVIVIRRRFLCGLLIIFLTASVSHLFPYKIFLACATF